MRIFFLITVCYCCVLFSPNTADAIVQLFTGKLEVVATSGRACAGRKGTHQVSLVFGSEEGSDVFFGYIGGDTVSVGQLRGTLPGVLTLSYPFPDVARAEGNSVRLELNGSTLRGELRDRHLDSTEDDCNFDLAQLDLVLTSGEETAYAAYQRFSKQFEAQLARSTALAVSRKGAHVEAVALFEKALSLADQLYPVNSSKLLPYLTGLANSYMRTARYDDFNRLYLTRIDTLHDEAVRQIFNHHQIRSLVQVGRAAMAREDYRTALYNFRQALKIDYKNKDTISATMSALVRSGQHDEAISFLEETEQKLDNEPDRQDVREAIALVQFQKARKEHKAGRTIEAERSMRKAIKLDPGTVHYLVVLARWMHKAGKYSEADAVLKRGLDSCTDEAKRLELREAREKLRMTERILTKMRMAGS